MKNLSAFSLFQLLFSVSLAVAQISPELAQNKLSFGGGLGSPQKPLLGGLQMVKPPSGSFRANCVVSAGYCDISSPTPIAPQSTCFCYTSQAGTAQQGSTQ
jgi:hypothetical protein